MLSLSIGTALSGTLAGFYNPNDGAAEQTYFMSLGTTAIVLGLIMWLLAKPIIKAFGGVR